MYRLPKLISGELISTPKLRITQSFPNTRFNLRMQSVTSMIAFKIPNTRTSNCRMISNQADIGKFESQEGEFGTCTGCGAPLQMTNPFGLGYIPSETEKSKPQSRNDFRHLFPELQDEPTLENLAAKKKKPRRVCQRCFVLKHQSKVLPIQIPISQFRNKLSSFINNKRCLVIKIVDLNDFAGTFLSNFHLVTGKKNPVIILANKADLLPKGFSQDRINAWVKRSIRQLDPDITDNVVAVHTISSLKLTNMDKVIKSIEEVRNGRDIFVVGCSNTGKSTFVTQLMQHYREFIDTDRSTMKPTVSPLPGTTLNLISVPLKKGGLLFDTPGILSKNQLVNFLTPSEVKMVLPKKRIKPQVYLMYPGKTLFIGGVGRFDYIEGPRMYFTLFFAPDLYIHATKTEKADQFYEKHLGGLLQPPIFKNKSTTATPKQTSEDLKQEGIEVSETKSDEIVQPEEPKQTEEKQTNKINSQPASATNETEELPLVGKRKGDSFPPLASKEWELEGDNWTDAFVDIVYAGLGWISVTGRGKIKVRAWGVQGTGLYLRDEPLMPFETPATDRPRIRPIKPN